MFVRSIDHSFLHVGEKLPVALLLHSAVPTSVWPVREMAVLSRQLYLSSRQSLRYLLMLRSEMLCVPLMIARRAKKARLDHGPLSSFS